jgi:hypothetical protein
MNYCGSCKKNHEIEFDPPYCAKCFNNYDSGCMNEIKGDPVCFNCTPAAWFPEEARA